jgi:hypothetical protein
VPLKKKRKEEDLNDRRENMILSVSIYSVPSRNEIGKAGDTA